LLSDSDISVVQLCPDELQPMFQLVAIAMCICVCTLSLAWCCRQNS